MFELSGILSGIQLLIDWQILLMILLGLIYGIFTGAVPGFSTPLAISVMLPLTFTMAPLQAIVFLTAIYAGGNFGSSISAILLNIPGSPQAVVTSLDGHPMTQQGKANEALGVALTSSATGNLIGSIFLILIMPFLVAFALKFGPPELFLVGVIALTVIASLHESFLKATIAGVFGVIIGTIGMTPTGAVRGTYGFYELMDGIPLIPALIGIIGFSELFYLLHKESIVDKEQQNDEKTSLRNVLMGYKIALKYPFTVIRSSIIGVLIGVLPGAGATIASIVSYNEGKKRSKNADKFGKGAPEGVVCSETANNASEGGALATVLALGIPGGLATAVLIGALMLQGLIPGPRLFADNESLVYGIMFSLIITSFLLFFVGLIMCYGVAKVVNIPTHVLIPVISVLSIIGTYAVNKSMFHVKLMMVFALLGIILRKYDYPLIAVILGIIIAPILDGQLLRTFQSGYDFTVFFTRPVSLILVILLFVSLIPTFKKMRQFLVNK